MRHLAGGDPCSWCSNRSAEQVRNDIERDKILTAEQAVEYGTRGSGVGQSQDQHPRVRHGLEPPEHADPALDNR